MAIKNGIPPRTISENLLSDEDKKDMLNGLLSEDELEAHVKVWIANGMPNQCSEISLKNDTNLKVLEGNNKWVLRKPFISREDYEKEKEPIY